ncbi:MAG: transketolase [Verrucomicrobia bacterium]|nr:transketolase [Verrucomicrobiota bacterium]
MAENNVVLTPLKIKSKLAPAPTAEPRYSIQIKNRAGQTVTVADPRATRALVALMDMHAVNGGAASHWGGPSAFAEISAAAHAIMFSVKGRDWFDAYNFVNDAGHAENGIYAIRANYGFDGMTFETLKGFRSFNSKLTGHGESHLNPEGVFLSNGPLGSSLPQAQGLAMADKVAGNDRVTLCLMSDGASMEGEAKEAFSAIPGFAAKGKMNPFVMLLSDNNTKLSGRIDKDSFSMIPTFEALSVLGWNVIKVVDGNCMETVYQAVESAIEQAKADPTRPVCVWFKTVKGKGVKSTEESASGGHGYPLKNAEKIVDFVTEIYGGFDKLPAEFLTWAERLNEEWMTAEASKKMKPAAAAPAVKKEKIQAGLARGAVKAAEEGAPVYSVSCDVQGSTGIAAFQKAFPDRFVEVGIAESNMISVAAGFSKLGFIPIVDAFGQFGVTKGNLPLTMANLSQAPVIGMFSHVGLQDAADGASHQATAYFAALSAIPHLVVVAPACAAEAESLMYQAIKKIESDRKAGKDGESVVFFVGREGYPTYWTEGAAYSWGKAQVLTQGSDVVIAACGPLLGYALKAAESLKTQGVAATVINNPFINRVDVETIGKAVKAAQGRIITVEDHQLICGMGAQIAHALVQNGIACDMRSLGIRGEFGRSAYKVEELYKAQGMYTDDIINAAMKLLKRW